MRTLALLGSFLLLVVGGAALVIYSQAPVKLDYSEILKKRTPVATTAGDNSTKAAGTGDGNSSPGTPNSSATANDEPRHPSLKGLNLYRLNGSSIATAKKDDTRVRYVLVYFSAHWCPPCRAFTPQLVSFYKSNVKKARDKNKSFEVVFVSNDNDEAQMQQYSTDANMTWMALKPDEGMSSSLARLCGPGIPCLVLLGPGGEVVASNAGGGRPSTAMAAMERLLN